MSLYNMLMGENPLAELLLACVNLKRADVPRYRNCYLSEDGEQIVVYTRTGGGNREEYMEENARLSQNPLFRGDHDDDFDPTYAYFNYAIPDVFKDDLKAMAQAGAGEKPAGDRMRDFIERIKTKGLDDPQVKDACETMRPILERIGTALNQ